VKLIWSPRARARSAEIVTHIIDEGRPQAAIAWIEGLERRVDLVRDAPLQGRQVPEWFDPKMREVFHKGFRVIYQVGDDLVEIVTIRHLREDLSDSGTEDSS